MKRSPKLDFDDQGIKWFESPAYKECNQLLVLFYLIILAKSYNLHSGGMVYCETPLSEIHSEGVDSTFSKEEKVLNVKTLKEKFYDFIKSLSKHPHLKIDCNSLNQNLTIKIERILDIHSICDIFEKICARTVANPRIKKNWSEEETTLFIWITLHYCHLKQKDLTLLVIH